MLSTLALAFGFLASVAAESTQSYSPEPTATGPFRSLTYIGCFDNATPLNDKGMYEFVSSGLCQRVCYQNNAAVMGLTDGTSCWCGDLLPAENAQVDNNTCTTTCNGYDQDICGGSKLWSVYLTGFSRNKIDYYEPQSSSSSAPSSTSPTSSPSSSETSSAPSSSPTDKPSSSPVGIIVGVVVGVIALAGFIGGIFLYFRNRRKDEQPPHNPNNPFSDPLSATMGSNQISIGDYKRDSRGSIASFLEGGQTRTLQVVNN